MLGEFEIEIASRSSALSVRSAGVTAGSALREALGDLESKSPKKSPSPVKLGGREMGCDFALVLGDASCGESMFTALGEWADGASPGRAPSE